MLQFSRAGGTTAQQSRAPCIFEKPVGSIIHYKLGLLVGDQSKQDQDYDERLTG
jgi:hypothetical protein